MEQEHAALAAQALLIDGVTYRLEPLSWMQNKWLGEHIFRGVDLSSLDYGTVHDILREKGPLFMAICLVRDGMTRKDHSSLPWDEIATRAEEFAVVLTGEEVAQFGPRFFIFNPPAQMAMLLSGRVLAQQIAALSPAPGPSGSSEASLPLPTATSPSAVLSSENGDRMTPSRSSNDVSNVEPSTGASWPGSTSSSRGSKVGRR